MADHILGFDLSDGSSLRLGPGSARARHLEGLLELGFCRLDPSIGWVKPQTQASGLRLGFGLSSEFVGSTHHYMLVFPYFPRIAFVYLPTQTTILSWSTLILLYIISKYIHMLCGMMSLALIEQNPNLLQEPFPINIPWKISGHCSTFFYYAPSIKTQKF